MIFFYNMIFNFLYTPTWASQQITSANVGLRVEKSVRSEMSSNSVSTGLMGPVIPILEGARVPAEATLIVEIVHRRARGPWAWVVMWRSLGCA